MGKQWRQYQAKGLPHRTDRCTQRACATNRHLPDARGRGVPAHRQEWHEAFKDINCSPYTRPGRPITPFFGHAPLRFNCRVEALLE
jgi:hypothetical protein